MTLPLMVYLNDDLDTNPPVVPRLFQVEAAHPCAVVQPPARFAEPAVHERRHEPVRAHFPRPGQMPLPAGPRGGHPEMHPRRRQTQRPRGRRPGHLSPHVFRDARQLELWRLFQKGSHRMGVGTGRGELEISRRSAFTPRFTTRTNPRATLPSATRRPGIVGRKNSAPPDSTPPSTLSMAARRTISG